MIRTVYTIAIVYLCYVLGAQAQDTYTFNFDRGMKAGQRYRINGEMTDDMKFIVTSKTDGKTQQEGQKTETTFRGILEIQSLNAAGNPTRARITVETLEQKANGETTALLKPGSTVVFRMQAQFAIYESGGARLDEDVENVLTSFLTKKGDVTEIGEQISSGEPVAVGDRWDLDLSDIWRKGLAQAGATKVDEATIDEYGQLIERVGPEDDPALRIAGTVASKEGGTPVVVRGLQGVLDLDMQIGMDLPIDTEQFVRTMFSKFGAHIVLTTPDEKVTMELTVTQVSSTSYELMK